MGVRHKLYLLLGICVVGFVCSFVADRVGKHTVAAYRSNQALAANAYLELLQARREEKNYLLHPDPALAEAVLRHADKVRENIRALADADAAMAAEVSQAASALDAYRRGFESLVSLQGRRGYSEHDGLMGAFVTAARALDDKCAPVPDKELQILLLTIRRHEKNWQLRDDRAYVDKVAAVVAQLRRRLADGAGVEPDRKADFAAVIDAYQRSFSDYVAVSEEFKRTDAAMVASGRELMPHFERIEAYYSDRRAVVERRVEWIQFAAQAVVGTVMLLVIVWCIRGIMGSLTALGRYSRKVASGDLSARPEGRFEIEFAALRDDTTRMVENLREKMQQAQDKGAEAAAQAEAAQNAMHETRRKQRELAETVGVMRQVAHDATDITRRLFSAARDLSDQTEQASQGVELQKRRVAETATAMEQMSATVMEIAANAGQAALSAGNTRENATNGAAVVQQACDSMAKVDTIAQELRATMANLGQEARSIGDVAGVINDIADQTNLLALNAAIEAARAGEAGRGFAVVADEVRKLAEKTMVATTEVETRIRAIQEAAQRNIAGMDQAVAAVSEASDLACRSGRAIEGIVNHADDASSQVQSIATAAEEQSAASEQINRALTEIDHVAEANVAGVEATSQAARTLAATAEELQRLIGCLRADEASVGALPEV